MSSITGLDKLTQLKKLRLDSSKISNINGLDSLTNLESLDLSGNGLTEIHTLNNLIKIKELNVSENNITQIKGLDKLINLELLMLDYNKIKDFNTDWLFNLNQKCTISLSGNPLDKITGKIPDYVTIEIDSSDYVPRVL